MKNKKQIIIGITVIVFVFLILLGLTYAYYRTMVVGNTQDKSISVTSKNLKIMYDDDTNEVISGEIEPDFNLTKTFYVKNVGDEIGYYSIIFENLNNNFIRIQDWTYQLKKNDEVVKEGQFPKSDIYMMNNQKIEAGVTDTYTLFLMYVDSEEEQSIDIGRQLSFKINMVEPQELFYKADSNTLLAAIGRDNSVSGPVTVPGKGRAGILNVEGEWRTDLSSSLSSSYLSQYMTYADGYEFDEESGLFTLKNVQRKIYSEIYNELPGKYIVNILPSNSTSIKTTDVSNIYQVVDATEEKIFYNSLTNSPVSITEAVLSATEDDYGTSYYFRGQVLNNYVNFSGMCWRIVRVQGDGNIKIALADRTRECNDENYSKNSSYGYIANQYFMYKSNFDNSENDISYKDSDLQVVLNTWLNGGEYTYYNSWSSSAAGTGTFEKVIDDTKLVETDWCSDTSVAYTRGLVEDKTFVKEYNVFKRLREISAAKPSLRCNFSGLEDSTSQKYNSKIGMLTADEVAFAGGVFNSSSIDYYLKEGASSSNYFTLTPLDYGLTLNTSYNNPSSIVTVSSYGAYISYTNLKNPLYVRPVVVLQKDVTITGGDGTQENPYVVEPPAVVEENE